MILVDTNVLIDIIESDPIWADWSQRYLDAASAIGEVAINDIIYAELSMGYQRIEELEQMMAQAAINLVPIPRAALFLAGKVFQQYRAAGGIRTGVLPDFFIGAQAAVMRVPLLTRDARRYRTYFTDIELIAPSVS
jgi:predicted nucleic acid-binding protein